ncbi:hypothetical protein V2A87_06170 [Pseudomonas aeruginosa]
MLCIATKANISALLPGTSTEEGRIGYVALKRAKNLFWLAVPNSAGLLVEQNAAVGAGVELIQLPIAPSDHFA